MRRAFVALAAHAAQVRLCARQSDGVALPQAFGGEQGHAGGEEIIAVVDLQDVGAGRGGREKLLPRGVAQGSFLHRRAS